jgi:hypothetical protein
MEITKLETRQPWLCEVDGHSYVRTEIQWTNDAPNDITWHLNEDSAQDYEPLTDEQLEKLFWGNYGGMRYKHTPSLVNIPNGDDFFKEGEYTTDLPNGDDFLKINCLSKKNMKDNFVLLKEQDNKLYSEEEVIELLNRREDYTSQAPKTDWFSISKWFEQFKNK